MLDLYNNPLSKLGSRSLVQSKLPMLSTLNIGKNSNYLDTMAELMQASWPLLQNLIARNNDQSTLWLHIIANSHWPLLLSLDLSDNNLTGKL